MTTTSHRDIFDLAPHVSGAFARRAAKELIADYFMEKPESGVKQE